MVNLGKIAEITKTDFSKVIGKNGGFQKKNDGK